MFHNELYFHLCFHYIINQYYMRLGVKENLFSASLSYKKRGRLKIVLQIEHLKTCKIGMVTRFEDLDCVSIQNQYIP